MMRGDEHACVCRLPAAQARRTDTLPSSTLLRLRGQANPQDRSEASVSDSSSQSSAVKGVGVTGRQKSPSAEADVCVLCHDPMDGPKKSLFELGFRHKYQHVCVYNVLKDGKYRSCPLCQTKIPAELQEKAITFIMNRLHKKTTVDPTNKPCHLYLVDYKAFPEGENGFRSHPTRFQCI